MDRTEREELNRRRFVTAGAAGLTWLGAGPALARPLPLDLDGRRIQGGWMTGRAAPRAPVRVDGVEVGAASARGLFFVGLDRDAPATVRVETLATDGKPAQVDVAVDRGVFAEQRVDGLPPQTVTPTDPKVLERIRRETALKQAAFASQADADDFQEGFARPLDVWRVTGRFGSRRILNGVPGRPHYGIDLAAPTGTPIKAPAAGLVVLAEPDLHFEGGLTLIDHGQGVISMYLHQSKLRVRKGERVTRGRVIGEVGATGRATGPHLCWRLKWRDRNLDPSLLIV